MNLFNIGYCLLLFLIGHFGSALFLYFVHRFVFHGKLRRYPVLKNLAKLHGLHHANLAAANLAKFIFVPLPIVLLLIGIVVGSSYFIGIYFGIGIASFGFLYAQRHWAIHHHDFSSRFFYHHDYHHRGNVLMNFSGVYPFIDRIFKTYVETRPNRPDRKKWPKLAYVKVRR
jgi:sterol desaturase/sphingolipid hydroxylase (fatty acid hydroxylase superfamily)